jgi:alkylated DNA repair dioxygenase AlkB
MFVSEGWQGSLLALGDPDFDPSFATVERIWLDDECWLDHRPGWLQGSDLVMAELVARVPWTQRRVPMYERVLDEPRLVWWWSETGGGDEAVLLPVLQDVRHALSLHYGRHFDSIGLNLYRDGHDSVAWHADRVRFQQETPIIAIVSVGAPRPFLMRPLGGGPSRSWLLGQGDLFVMGGWCQHAWQHTVPKIAHAAGPRLSITFRHGGDPPELNNQPVGQPRRSSSSSAMLDASGAGNNWRNVNA